MTILTYEGVPCRAAGHTLRYKSSGACVACALNNTRQWHAENPQRAKATKALYYGKHRAAIVARVALWRYENPDKAKAHADKKYGRCAAAATQARREHDGRCAVCETTEPGGRGGWHVDHVHDSSGDVRGVLCYHCNTGIGSLRDSPSLLKAALTYLQRPPKYKGIT